MCLADWPTAPNGATDRDFVMTKVFLEDLKKDFRSDEGVRNLPYKDTRGVLTIGVGHNLNQPLSAKVIEIILEEDIHEAIRMATSLCNRTEVRWETLPREVQEVLIKMAFQLGYGGLEKFRMMWLAVSVKDWESMQAEMLDSKWARDDTPERAKRTAEILDPLIRGHENER